MLLVLFLAVLLFGGLMLTVLDDGALSYADAFYVIASTATTTGYGDVAPHTPRARWFLLVYQFIPVIAFFTVVRVLLQYDDTRCYHHSDTRTRPPGY